MEESLDSRVWLGVRRTHDVLKGSEDRVLGKLGLTSEQFGVLMAIGSGGSARPTDVARQLTRSANSVSMLVDRMVRAGLLRRVRDKHDRRVVNVFVTEKAKRVLAPAVQARKELAQAVSAVIPDENKRTLVALLEALQAGVPEEE